MKTIENLEKAFASYHPSTQYVMIASMNNMPVGSDVYEEAIANNPELFKEEVEWRRKMALVPEEVHEAYRKESSELFDKHYNAPPHAGMGMMWYIEHPKEAKDFNDFWNRNRDVQRKEENDLFNKHYSKYGLTR